MIYKIHEKLDELEIDLPLDKEVYHSKFISELNKFDELIKTEEDKNVTEPLDTNLCLLFDELHDIEIDEPIETDPENKSTNSTIDETEKQILNILNNKITYTLPELESIGIDLKKIAYKFRYKGFVFQKRFLLKEYSIVQKPNN